MRCSLDSAATLQEEEKAVKEVELQGGVRVKVLPDNDGTEYLGRYLCMEEMHDEELQHRVRKAWKKFWAKSE